MSFHEARDYMINFLHYMQDELQALEPLRELLFEGTGDSSRQQTISFTLPSDLSPQQMAKSVIKNFGERGFECFYVLSSQADCTQLRWDRTAGTIAFDYIRRLWICRIDVRLGQRQSTPEPRPSDIERVILELEAVRQAVNALGRHVEQLREFVGGPQQ